MHRVCLFRHGSDKLESPAGAAGPDRATELGDLANPARPPYPGIGGVDFCAARQPVARDWRDATLLALIILASLPSAALGAAAGFTSLLDPQYQASSFPLRRIRCPPLPLRSPSRLRLHPPGGHHPVEADGADAPLWGHTNP